MGYSVLLPFLIQSLGWRSAYAANGLAFFLLTVPPAFFLLRDKAVRAGKEESRLGGSCEMEGISYNEALRMPQFWLIAVALLAFSASISITQHLPAHFVNKGFSAMESGYFMVVAAVGIVVTSAIMGALANKIGLVKALILASILYALSFGALSMASAPVMICVALCFVALGNCYTSLFAPIVVSDSFGLMDYPKLWGIMSMVTTLGQALGAPLWGISYDATGGYEAGMAVALITVVAVLILLIFAMRSAARRLRKASPAS